MTVVTSRRRAPQGGKAADPAWRHARAVRGGIAWGAAAAAAHQERGERHATKGDAYAAGYRLGYQQAYQRWKRWIRAMEKQLEGTMSISKEALNYFTMRVVPPIQAGDVVVIEAAHKLTEEEIRNISTVAAATFPEARVIVLEVGLHLRIEPHAPTMFEIHQRAPVDTSDLEAATRAGDA